MPSLLTFLFAVVGPLARRVLSSLGIGWVVYSGYTLIIEQIKTQVSSYWGAMSADMLALMSLAGFGEAFGIILGALAYRGAVLALGHLGRVAT